MFALIRFEFKKLLAQRKSLVGLLNVLLMNILFSAGFYVELRRRGNEPSMIARDFLVSDFMNAYMYTQSILAFCVYLVFPMVLAILGAYMIAGELEVGNMRMMLFRPVSRKSVVFAKFVVLTAYAAGLVLILGVSSYLLSALHLPTKGLIVIPPKAIFNLPELSVLTEEQAPGRIILTYLLSIPSLMSVCAMALMFSMMMRHYTSAAILTTTVYLISYIIGEIDFLAPIHAFMPSRYWPFWRYALLDPIPWWLMIEHAFWTVAYTFGFLAVAAAIFDMKDV